MVSSWRELGPIQDTKLNVSEACPGNFAKYSRAPALCKLAMNGCTYIETSPPPRRHPDILCTCSLGAVRRPTHLLQCLLYVLAVLSVWSVCAWSMMMIAFNILNSSLVPLIEGLCSSNPCGFEFPPRIPSANYAKAWSTKGKCSYLTYVTLVGTWTASSRPSPPSQLGSAQNWASCQMRIF